MVFNKNETIQPKTGQNHKIFGVKYLKFHRMREILWNPTEKIQQFKAITNLYGMEKKLSIPD